MGKAYAPGKKPTATCPVRVRVGSLEKSLYVVGDRYWRRGVPTQPELFTEMELSWANAFGGEGYDKNPRGKGFAPVKGETGVEIHALPNLEAPGRMLTSPKERPEPAGFGPLEFVWPQRFSMSGTYDKRWMETRFPGFAEDMDWRIWNMAPADQQQEGFFTGSEQLFFENMHPEKPQLTATLPNIRARSFVTRHDDDAKALHEVELRLTTLWLFPDVERGVVIFQGAIPVQEDDAADIDVVMIAAERPNAPRTMDHYREVLAKRLDSERLEETLNDADLVPPELAGLGSEIDHHMKLTSVEGLRAKRKRMAAAADIDAARARVAEFGLDPDEHAPGPLPPEDEIPGPSEVAAFVKKKRAQMEEVRAAAEKRQQEAIEEAAAFYAEVGLDFDEVREEMKTPHRGPPDFSAEAHRARFRQWAEEAKAAGQPAEEFEEYATSEKQWEQWTSFEERLRATYRAYAHFQKPAPAREDGDKAAIRAAVLAGESFAGKDLTGLDLSELDSLGRELRWRVHGVPSRSNVRTSAARASAGRSSPTQRWPART